MYFPDSHPMRNHCLGGSCIDVQPLLVSKLENDPTMKYSPLMTRPGLIHRYWPGTPTSSTLQLAPWKRFARTEAFESSLDPADLSEARKWRQNVNETSLPKGSTTFARSSGPGGQHVNKTETKAITTWSISELTQVTPKLVHPLLRTSNHYVKNKDSLSFQAQDSRDRNANADDNRSKLLRELQRMYNDVVPSDTSVEKKQKHAGLERSFRESRLKSKKFQSSKKSARRGDF
ncbi:hypothetical protein N0V93_008724 [Gnomoniopsis smithogilvyi]|uniref:Prokaryotic-type class I peptide chain release factors domain-containing protein n=1 Tax=Gnomoniopsis smithogilvyi TaxID=1191159 RepID=A0A9W8YM84_9PEZI|nr:hypothetical protein N0V93_008724 [Gnomoniopsis smithogilvyi]